MCSWHAFRRRPLCHSVLVAEGYKDRARSWGTLGEASSDATRSTASSEANLELGCPGRGFQQHLRGKNLSRYDDGGEYGGPAPAEYGGFQPTIQGGLSRLFIVVARRLRAAGQYGGSEPTIQHGGLSRLCSVARRLRAAGQYGGSQSTIQHGGLSRLCSLWPGGFVPLGIIWRHAADYHASRRLRAAG